MHHPHPAAKAQDPPHEFAIVRYGESHGEFAAFERCQGLRGVPDAVFDPGGCGCVEPEFDLDGMAAHDADGIFDIVFDVEVQGDLERVIGEGDRFDAFHGEHAHVFSEVAIPDEIQGAVGVPQAIGTDFPSGYLISGHGEVPHLHGVEFGRGFGQVAMVS